MGRVKEFPIAFEFDKTRRNCANLPLPGGFAILYKCPKCGNPMCVWLGTKEKFCHNCGTEINWNVITFLNSYQSYLLQDDESKYKEVFLKVINRMNIEENFESEVFFEEDNGFVL